MAEKLYSVTVKDVPHSSVVGRSVMIVADKIGVVAQLMISVPQPNLNYKTISNAIVKALINGHFESGGMTTLVLPDDLDRYRTRN